MGLLCGEGCMILTSTVFDWSTRVTDGQTDGQWHIARYSIMLSRAKTILQLGLGLHARRKKWSGHGRTTFSAVHGGLSLTVI